MLTSFSFSGVCRESGIPNVFTFVGNLSAARINSKVLALTIKQQLLGIWGERCEPLCVILIPVLVLTSAIHRHDRVPGARRCLERFPLDLSAKDTISWL